MPLSCDCDFDADGEADWYFNQPHDYSILQTSRRQRCWSCNELIDLGSVVNQYSRWRYPNSDIELRIHDWDEAAEIYLGTKYHCESCADLAWSLAELGFCWTPFEDQRELVKQYAEFQKTGYMPEDY